MRIKETIYMTYDAQGHVVKRITKVEVFESEPVREEDYCGYGRNGGLHQASGRRIREAIEDYRMSDEW